MPAGDQNLVVWQEKVGYATPGGGRGMPMTVAPARSPTWERSRSIPPRSNKPRSGRLQGGPGVFRVGMGCIGASVLMLVLRWRRDRLHVALPDRPLTSSFSDF